MKARARIAGSLFAIVITAESLGAAKAPSESAPTSGSASQPVKRIGPVAVDAKWSDHVSAITDRSPYGVWSDDMKAVLDHEQPLTFTFYFQ